jgi:hypothetical protein
MNREQRLKSYHERKVAERRQRHHDHSSVDGAAVTNNAGGRSIDAEAGLTRQDSVSSSTQNDMDGLLYDVKSGKAKQAYNHPTVTNNNNSAAATRSPVRSTIRPLPSYGMKENLGAVSYGKMTAAVMNPKAATTDVDEPQTPSLAKQTTAAVTSVKKHAAASCTKQTPQAIATTFTKQSSLDKSEMKRIFAARRRKAQIEMNATAALAVVDKIDDGRGVVVADGRVEENAVDKNEESAVDKNGEIAKDAKDTSTTCHNATNSEGGGDNHKKMNNHLRRDNDVTPKPHANGKSGGNENRTASSNSRRAFEMYTRQNLRYGQSVTTKDAVTNKDEEMKVNKMEMTSSSAKEKTVRFLSPLERRNPQCSPPRMRLPEVVDGDVQEEEEVVDEMKQEVEEEDVDFLLFVAGLKREVAGDHTEV